MSTRPLAYVIESRQIGGTWIGFVIVKCSACKKITELKWPGHHNPNHISKHFNRLGWDFNPFRSGNRCPACNKPALLAGPSLPDFSSFGKRLKWVREQVHIGRDQLADEANIPRLLVEHLEADTASDLFRLENSTAVKLSIALINHGSPLDSDWLIGKSEKPNTLAARLRALMDKYSHTEGSLASTAEVPISDIKSLLSGHLQTHYKIEKIAETLHVSVLDLVGEKIPRVLSANPPPVISAPPPAPIATKPVRVEPPKPSRVATLATTVFGDIPGEGLRKMREGKQITQGELARMIGKRDVPWKAISIQSLLSKIERGEADKMACRDQLLTIAAAILEDVTPKKTKAIKVKVEPSKAVAIIPPIKANLPAVPANYAGLQADLRKATNDLGDLKNMASDLTTIAGDLSKRAVEVMNDLKPLYQLIADTVGRVEVIQAQISQKKSEKPTKEKVARRSLPAPTRGDHLSMIGGMWIYRRIVPKHARAEFGLWEVKRKLGTDDFAEALRLKRPFERAFERRLAAIQS